MALFLTGFTPIGQAAVGGWTLVAVGAQTAMTAIGVICGLFGAGLLYLQYASDSEAAALLTAPTQVLPDPNAQ